MMATRSSSPVLQDTATAVRGRLMALVREGVSAPDGRLPTERALCETMGVSRRIVRRALESLEAEGLVWRKQGKGTFAGQPPQPGLVLAAGLIGETDFMEVMEARLCLEPGLAGMAARRALPADIERMRNLARRAVESIEPDHIELWDSALHRMIARTAGNAPLLAAFSMLDEIRSNASWRALRSRARSIETLRVSDREHAGIIDAIESGQPDRAETAMRRHLITLAENLERILGTSADQGD
jgi:GntR family transcriptional repressor for pyruvate dehydrogenase complex